MRYPQAYVLIDEEYEMPPIATVQGWTSSKAPIYIQGISKANQSMEERIEAIKNIHRCISGKWSAKDHAVVFTGKKVGYFLTIATGNYFRKIYWIDSAEHATSILRVNHTIDKARDFEYYIREAEETYCQVSNFIAAHTGDKPFRDEQLERFFDSRMWGDRSTAEHYLKRIAKNETRAGILQRLDL